MKEEQRFFLIGRPRAASHSVFGNKHTRREGKLIENAFLLSSVIEILTTKPLDQNRLNPRESKMFHDLAGYLEKIQSTEAHMANENIQLMLQPEDVELLATMETLGEKSLSRSIRGAINTLKRITTEESIPFDDRKSIDDLANLLRSLFNGIRLTISQDQQRENLDPL